MKHLETGPMPDQEEVHEKEEEEEKLLLAALGLDSTKKRVQICDAYFHSLSSYPTYTQASSNLLYFSLHLNSEEDF